MFSEPNERTVIDIIIAYWQLITMQTLYFKHRSVTTTLRELIFISFIEEETEMEKTGTLPVITQ